MLSRFHVLPSEPRAQAMKGRDYLWCLAHELLDREERLDRLCPSCRSRALESSCPVCGKSGEEFAVSGASFDPARFEQLKGGAG